MTGERIFQILAVVFAGVAAYFLWQGETDWLFVAAVLGACSFFISIRFQIKDRALAREAAEAELAEEPADDAEPEETPTNS
jgi:hypothetical protein